MNENELYTIKEHIFDNPLFTEIDTTLDSCFNDWQNSCFQNFIYERIYDIQLPNITNFEIIHLTISGKSTNLYDLKKVTVARENRFVSSQVNKLIIKSYSRKRYENLC